MIYEKYLKRFFDLILSITLLVFSFPLLVIIAIMVYLDLGRPILFVQQRPGYKEKIFKMYKFRTMIQSQELVNAQFDQHRVTKLGNFLRKTSLDELPELFNILFGKMSFVGPRPLLREYLSKYNSLQKKRHDVKPGLTGLAQVNGRNAITWDEKFYWDLQYVRRISFFLDLKILFKTFFVLLNISKSQPKNRYSMDYFKGNHNNERD